jgi:hypothetical protein
MCRSIQDSVTAGLIIHATALILVLTGKPEYLWLGAFVFSVGMMQWADAIIWYQRAHQISTIFVSRYVLPLILLSEPICAYLGYLHYYKQRIIPFELLMALYLSVHMLTWMSECIENTSVTADGYLKWCNFDITDIPKIAYLFFLVFPFLFFPDKAVRTIILF